MVLGGRFEKFKLEFFGVGRPENGPGDHFSRERAEPRARGGRWWCLGVVGWQLPYTGQNLINRFFLNAF